LGQDVVGVLPEVVEGHLVKVLFSFPKRDLLLLFFDWSFTLLWFLRAFTGSARLIQGPWRCLAFGLGIPLVRLALAPV
jgi:hypothetical protein